MRCGRIDKHIAFLQMAQVLSRRSTCARRAVGCILTDQYDHIIGSGYNGNAAGLYHCIDKYCKGAKSVSGNDLELCEAIHAEQNALMQCPDVKRIVTCYVTTMPCVHCVKMLMNTSCQTIWYLEEYPHADMSIRLWEKAGRTMLCGDR